MRFRSGRSVALGAAVLMTAFLIPMGPAQAQTTYVVEFGQDFFETANVPGFSTRFYPGSVTLHKGDTIQFTGFGAPLLFPEGQVPSDELETRAARIGDELFFAAPDPDEGPDAAKFNPALDGEILDCGTVDNPCVWDGSAAEPLVPHFTTAPPFFVTIDANPGDVIYAAGGFASNFRIEVVPNGEAADTQADLSTRADALKDKDYNDAVALHNKFSDRQTSHRTANGTLVHDIYGGLDQGPISMLAMYPRKVKVKQGERVQFHFALEGEIHNVVMPKGPAFSVLENFFVPLCDTDGDQGTAADVPADFDPAIEDFSCPQGSVLEFDLDERGVNETGNGALTGPNDLESSGLKWGERLSPQDFAPTPWTVRMKAASPEKGWKFFCTVHGPFMGGHIIVK
jgi:plastocyanin